MTVLVVVVEIVVPDVPRPGLMTFEQRHSLGGKLGEDLPQLVLLHQACFSLHVIQTRVQGIAFSRAAAISSPQSRQTP